MFIAEFKQYLFGFSIFISSLFLVMLVLVQRGRGGGLTGALGGAGGQSAFGTKAGDLFTRITIVVATVWIFLCASAVYFLKDRALPQTGVADKNVPTVTGNVEPGAVPPADGAGTSSGLSLPPLDVTSELTAPNVPAVEVPAVEVPTGTQAEVTDPGQLEPSSPAEPAAIKPSEEK